MPSSDASYINATNGEKKQENNDDDYREIDHKLKKTRSSLGYKTRLDRYKGLSVSDTTTEETFIGTDHHHHQM